MKHVDFLTLGNLLIVTKIFSHHKIITIKMEIYRFKFFENDFFAAKPNLTVSHFCYLVPISHIVALVGDSAYLPCDISTTHEGDSVHLVLWYREDLGTSVYR